MTSLDNGEYAEIQIKEDFDIIKEKKVFYIAFLTYHLEKLKEDEKTITVKRKEGLCFHVTVESPPKKEKLIKALKSLIKIAEEGKK